MKELFIYVALPVWVLKKLGAPTALKELGMPEDGLDRAADRATTSPYWNPRPIERDGIQLLLEDAYDGRWPRK